MITKMCPKLGVRLYTDTPYSEPQELWPRILWWLRRDFEIAEIYVRERERQRSVVENLVTEALNKKEKTPGGVWVAYYHDWTSMLLFETELEALRHAVPNVMTVKFMAYGKDLHLQDD